MVEAQQCYVFQDSDYPYKKQGCELAFTALPTLDRGVKKVLETVSKILLKLGHQFFGDRKSTRLNSSHVRISYAVFCLKKKKKKENTSYKTTKKATKKQNKKA